MEEVNLPYLLPGWLLSRLDLLKHCVFVKYKQARTATGIVGPHFIIVKVNITMVAINVQVNRKRGKGMCQHTPWAIEVVIVSMVHSGKLESYVRYRGGVQ